MESTAAMVVGLGNPGSKYIWTRHNIGFEVLNRLHRELGEPSLQTKFEGQYVKTKFQGRDLILVWPLTFMNCSGRCVSQFLRFYRIAPTDTMVVCDDLSLPLGKLRIRKSGSSGGQKGLGDILQRAATQDIPRLRIGIGATPERWETADYVLSRFADSENVVVQESLARSVEAIGSWLKAGIDATMNLYNAESSKKASSKSTEQEKRRETSE